MPPQVVQLLREGCYPSFVVPMLCDEDAPVETRIKPAAAAAAAADVTTADAATAAAIAEAARNVVESSFGWSGSAGKGELATKSEQKVAPRIRKSR